MGGRLVPQRVARPSPMTTTWAPTPTDVARLLRARTKDSNGSELGDWSEDTRPTTDEVQDLIEQAADLIAARCGSEIADPCAEGATRVTTLLAAMLVELSYFPEQVRSDRSAYSEYKVLYDSEIEAVVACVSGGGEGLGPDEGEGYGYHSLPVVPETTARALGSVPPELSAATLLGPWGDLPPDGPWPEPENPENWAQTLQPPREPPLPEDLPIGEEPASGEEV